MDSTLYPPDERPTHSEESNSRPSKPLLSLHTDHSAAASSSTILQKRTSPSHTDDLHFTASPAVGHSDHFLNFPSSFDPVEGRHSAVHDNNNNNTQPGVRRSSKDLATVTSEAIFKQLDRIKTLQNEIARSHALLERGEAEGSKSPKSPLFNSSSGFEFGDKGKEKEKEKDGGLGTGSKIRNGEKDRTRAYEEMEVEFRERQKGVDEVMLKVCDTLLSSSPSHN